MADRICVTRITLEYWAEGKLFAVHLDPMKVASIFFDAPDLPGVNPVAGRLDMKAAKDALPKPLREPPWNPLQTLEAQGLADLSGATSVQIGTDPRDPGGPSPWWHTNACSWFHAGPFG